MSVKTNIRNLNDENETFTTQEERWRQYFVETAQEEQLNREEENTQQIGNIKPTTKEYLIDPIGKLKIGKAVRYDVITSEMMKYLD